ncbi:MAG: tetratricopeptide repeat protein [Akkermansiaceae bacterium]|nr:tetratricopeptide repeat protein [Akkermansiaceae bacterium]
MPCFALFLTTSALAAPAKDADAWAVRGAPYRLPLQAESPPSVPEAGWQIRLPDFAAGRADMADVVLLDEKNREIALDPVWCVPGGTLLLLAESMPENNGRAMLYFGGNSSRRMKNWTAKRSLLLETRRLPAAAKISSYAEWRQAWRRAPSDGMAFVPNIFHGGNPFGADGHYLSLYTGLLKTGGGGERKFYTLSDDASFVTIDGRPALKWSATAPPPLAPDKVPLTTVRLPKDLAAVEYAHAVADPPGAMVLGWETNGKLATIPPDAWVQPGRARTGPPESADSSPVPAAEFEAECYYGYGGEWFVLLKARTAEPPAGWSAEWLWPDGTHGQGPETRRLWFGLDPARVALRLRQAKLVKEGRRTLPIPRDLPARSINNKDHLARLLELLAAENPDKLPAPSRRAGFVLARDFLPTADAARWAEAWLTLARPGDGPWSAAMAMAVRATARSDPKAALRRLADLPGPAREALGPAADLLELDILVLDLRDPAAVGLANRLARHPDKSVAAMARIRLGDYHLAHGRIEEALRCFAAARPATPDAERQAPVIDRSHALALEELIARGHLNPAREKLEAWERLRPAARLDGDQLLWRARVSFLAGEWQRALRDLETCLQIRPGAPEEIEILFWQGRALHELGRHDQARQVWQDLLDRFPKHERAESARQWLQQS